MTKTPDMAQMFKDAMEALPFDASAAEGTFKSSADLNEKIGAVSLSAAGKSATLSEKWAKETLKDISEVTKAKEAPADYMQAMSDFVTGYSKRATEHMAAFAEIAKEAQSNTVELMTETGKNIPGSAKTATKAAKSSAK